MIKPLPPSEESNQNFVVVDIENKPSGEVIAIDCCWRVHSRLEHFTCKDWTTFWPWLIAMAKVDEDFRTVYAHNGGGWDWVSLIAWLVDTNKLSKKNISIVSVGSRIIFMMIVIEKDCTIKFCDSMALLRSGLDDLGKVFFGRGKVDRGGKMPHEIQIENPALFQKYLHGDTELCLQVLEKSLETIRDEIAPIGSMSVTIGSTAMKVFRHFLDREIPIPSESDVKMFLRRGYKGGRVEVFKYGYHKNIKVYDINSLYPYAMSVSRVPISDKGYWCKKLTLSRCGVWDVSGIQRNKSIPPVLLPGISKATDPYCFKGKYFSDELELLMEVGNPEIKLEIGYVFKDTDFIFREWVDKLYGLRLKHPDSAISLLCKYLLNSCYGKFGQKTEREMIQVVESFEEMRELAESGKTRIIDEDRLILGVTKSVKCNHEHVGIAGVITSRARCELYKGMIHAGDNLVYVDTDSVHTTGSLPDKLVGNGLGLFKLEFVGEGVYCGRKTYGLRDTTKCPIHKPLQGKGTEKIRAKGVRVSKLRNCTLNFDDLCRISKGEEIDTVFETTATPLEAMRGKGKVCAFGSESKLRKRKVRVT